MKKLHKLGLCVAVLLALLVAGSLMLTLMYDDTQPYPTVRESMLRLKPGEYPSAPQQLAQQTLTASEDCSFEDVKDIAYWKPGIKEDEKWVSPYAALGPQHKYVVFEPDEGGWNNLSTYTCYVNVDASEMVGLCRDRVRVCCCHSLRDREDLGVAAESEDLLAG